LWEGVLKAVPCAAKLHTLPATCYLLEVFDIIGRPHGVLIFSTHDIPLHTPPENIETMVRTIKEECVY
jgi:hypothetical protein